MRVQKISVMAIVLTFTTCLALSCISSTFAQCPPDTLPCTGFPDWCCFSEEFCVDPTPPDCQRIDATTTTSVLETTTTSVDETITTTSCIDIDCGDGSCCPTWGLCCKGICCDEETDICDNGQCRRVCFFFQSYGESSVEVELLRNFRDEVLSQTPEGQELIDLYYQWSPAIVKAMEADEEFKQDVKEMVDGVLELMGGKME